MHQAHGLLPRTIGRMFIEFKTLEQGGCTVTHPDDCDPNLRHFPLQFAVGASCVSNPEPWTRTALRAQNEVRQTLSFYRTVTTK